MWRSSSFCLKTSCCYLLRTRLRQQRRYRLADALLELLRPRLEAAELWVEDDQGGTRLVPHRGASAARRSARAARAAKARRGRALWAPCSGR